MFDSFKGFGARKSTSEAAELQGLVDAARQERQALGAVLSVLSTSGAQLSQLGMSLEQVDHKVSATVAHMDEVSKRMEGLEDRAQALGHVESRVTALIAAATHAQEVTAKILASDGDLQAHRRQLHDLSTLTHSTQASIAALTQEQRELDGFRDELRRTQAEIKQSGENAGEVRGELARLHAMTQRLGAEHATLQDGLRSAREDSTRTLDAVKATEALVGPLSDVRALSKSTEDQVASLQALTQQVSRKTEALEERTQAIDHAVLEANRVSELVWGMDLRLGKLHEGLNQAARAEEALGRIQQIVDQTTARVEAATAMRDAFTQDAARFETDGLALAALMRALVERVSLDKQEFETFDTRAQALRASVADAEGRLQTLLEKQQYLSLLDQRANSLSDTVATLLGQADALAHKQSGLEALHEQLAQIDRLSQRTAAQYEDLAQRHGEVDQLRRDVDAMHHLHVDVVELRDKLTADRTALEAFSDRLTLFRAETPGLDAKMDSILGKLSHVDDGTKAVARLGDLATGLEDQLTRVGSRIQLVEGLEGRLTELQAVSVEVDRKLGEQLGRRAELDIVKVHLDAVVEQMVSAWHQLESIDGAQRKLLPLRDRLVALEQDLCRVTAGLRNARLDEAVVKAQEARLGDLSESSRLLAAETADRMHQLNALREEVGRSVAAKDELVAQISQAQAGQREVLSQVEAAQTQLARAQSLHQALEQRQTELRLAERTCAGVEAKLEQIASKSTDLDATLKALADREAIVTAVKAEVDTVHEISARSKADLQYLAQHRDEVAALRDQVHDLLVKTEQTEDRLAFVRAQRHSVDEVSAQAQFTMNLLEEVRAGLESVSEQKVLIDHVREKLTRLEFVTQAAERAVQTLQQEREVAERLEQSLKQIRARITPDKPLARSLAASA